MMVSCSGFGPDGRDCVEIAPIACGNTRTEDHFIKFEKSDGYYQTRHYFAKIEVFHILSIKATTRREFASTSASGATFLSRIKVDYG